MLLGFKKQFAPKIEAGSKIHTFRNTRKITPKNGEKIYAYTGLRTKFTKKILGEYVYSGSPNVLMHISVKDHGPKIKLRIGDKEKWTYEELDSMAKNDGFEDIIDFCTYWLDGKLKVGFKGTCYHWTEFRY